jgi:hypothetical protein
MQRRGIHEYKLQFVSLHVSCHIFSVYQMALEVSWICKQSLVQHILFLVYLLLDCPGSGMWYHLYILIDFPHCFLNGWDVKSYYQMLTGIFHC